MQLRRPASGFTLIELMIVVLVIAIIAAIAYPSYREYVVKSRRSHAKAGLLDVQLREEKWRANNITYTATITDLGLPGGWIDDDGNFTADNTNAIYQVTITNTDSASYTISADPNGIQAVDTGCDPMTIDQDNSRTPATGCW